MGRPLYVHGRALHLILVGFRSVILYPESWGSPIFPIGSIPIGSILVEAGGRYDDRWGGGREEGAVIADERATMVEMDDSRFAQGSEVYGCDRPVTPQERYVTGVYRAVDEVTAREIDRLRCEEGIVPTCQRGCCHCCRYHIVTNIAEAHVLAQYVKREFTTDQIDALRRRTQQWHAWDNSRPGRHPSPPIIDPMDVLRRDPYCPLLVDGACSVYPARPIICRTHFVQSPAVFCRAASDPDATQDAPVVLTAVLEAAEPSAQALRELIEHAGLDYSRSLSLLPHGLAHHMAWDFALSP